MKFRCTLTLGYPDRDGMVIPSRAAELVADQLREAGREDVRVEPDAAEPSIMNVSFLYDEPLVGIDVLMHCEVSSRPEFGICGICEKNASLGPGQMCLACETAGRHA